jgi:hypothetical protein
VSKEKSENINYIVVPDGVAADKDGKPMKRPSFVYRQVLDYVLKTADDKDSIYLAPANDFGCGKYEQELGFEYLKESNRNLNLICPKTKTKEYLDTYGNVLHLKSFLNRKIDNLVFELVCAFIHSFRAEYCFKKSGFHISKVHRVKYEINDEHVVRRLWYYKSKPVHILYELIAFTRDLIKLR